MPDLQIDAADAGRDLTVDDDDAELAAFFAGEDLTGEPVPDGGKCQKRSDFEDDAHP